jgi:hypothetical protein
VEVPVYRSRLQYQYIFSNPWFRVSTPKVWHTLVLERNVDIECMPYQNVHRFIHRNFTTQSNLNIIGTGKVDTTSKRVSNWFRTNDNKAPRTSLKGRTSPKCPRLK